jgi:sugar phosphate isomerase/epimerase
MLLRHLNDAQLTYCTNVHPGETLPEVRGIIERRVVAVKSAVSPDAPFGVGLRLAAGAARELTAEGELERFRQELDERKLYCFTINGFPYGAFHGATVKEHVYLPDWREPERLRYTQDLAQILAALLPIGVAGSISTVPGCFKPNAEDPTAPAQMAEHLLQMVATLVDLARSKGRHVALALEPEPECFLETTSEAVSFFEQHLLSRKARDRLLELADLEPNEAERALRRHLGVCLDTCHASVEFEAPLDAWRELQAAGISVPKVQLSAGLRLPDASPERLRALAEYAEGVYLHQTVVKTATGLERYRDLPQALEEAPRGAAEWRVHFHVPIFLRDLGFFESTQDDLVPLLTELSRVSDCPQLEVETYTWDVLPEHLKQVPIEVAIARELEFVQAVLAGALQKSP